MKLKELLYEIKNIQETIGTSEVMICGGAARDKYLNSFSKLSDIDLTTGDKTIQYLSEETYNFLSKKYNVSKKTMIDGHSSIYIGNLKIDFSSNFNVINIDKILYIKNIKNPTNMQREIYSRDFTCNALLMDLNLNKIIDLTNNGFKDIKDKKIKTCLPPELTLVSNKNRVIRSIYLASKLNFDIDSSIIDFVNKNPNSIKISSHKTLCEKLDLSFNIDSDKTVYYLDKMNLWNHIPITQIAHPYYIKHKERNGK